MNWILILALSSIGILMGIGSIFGLSGWGEYLVWIILAGGTAAILPRNINEKIVGHGFMVGFIACVIVGLFRFIFFSTYVENNDALLPRPQLLAESFMEAIVIGILFGICAAIGQKIAGPAQEMPEEPAQRPGAPKKPPTAPPGQQPKL